MLAVFFQVSGLCVCVCVCVQISALTAQPLQTVESISDPEPSTSEPNVRRSPDSPRLAFSPSAFVFRANCCQPLNTMRPHTAAYSHTATRVFEGFLLRLLSSCPDARPLISSDDVCLCVCVCVCLYMCVPDQHGHVCPIIVR